MYKNLAASGAVCALLSLSTPAFAGTMQDCTYKGKISGKTATIVVQDGAPVSYNWGTYNARNVSLRGDTINIDQAAIENLRVGATKSGKPAFQGKWRFNGSNSNVTFTC